VGDEESPARKYVRIYLVREVSCATIDIDTFCAHNSPHPSAYSATLRGIHLPRWGRLRLELRNEAARRGRRALQQRMYEIHYTVRWGADRQRNNAFSLFSNPKPVGDGAFDIPPDVQLTKSPLSEGAFVLDVLDEPHRCANLTFYSTCHLFFILFLR